MEEALKSTEEKKRLNAINTLSHLSNVLHLPVITAIVEQLKNASSDEQNELIKSLYVTLARLTTTEVESVEVPTMVEKEISTESFDIEDDQL